MIVAVPTTCRMPSICAGRISADRIKILVGRMPRPSRYRSNRTTLRSGTLTSTSPSRLTLAVHPPTPLTPTAVLATAASSPRRRARPAVPCRQARRSSTPSARHSCLHGPNTNSRLAPTRLARAKRSCVSGSITTTSRWCSPVGGESIPRKSALQDRPTTDRPSKSSGFVRKLGAIDPVEVDEIVAGKEFAHEPTQPCDGPSGHGRIALIAVEGWPTAGQPGAVRQSRLPPWSLLSR